MSTDTAQRNRKKQTAQTTTAQRHKQHRGTVLLCCQTTQKNRPL